MTKNEAISKAETKWWENSTPVEIVEFQLFEAKLCMPFDEFQASVEKVLKRRVFTHEFASPEILQREFREGVEPSSHLC